MANRIFIIEDDAALRTELARILNVSGFEASFCEEFAHAARHALDAQPDLVILDLKLPGNDGHSICREIRAQSDVPVIILTSSDSEFDEVMGMNLGADGYMTKPYNPNVLIAHIHSVLRRTSRAVADLVIEHRGVRLNVASGVVSYQDEHGEEKRAEMARNELKILHLLMQNPGTVITRSEIMCHLWESDAFVDDNTLTVNVNRLRKTLGAIGAPDDFLVTRRGLGYAV